ncbi:putative Acyl-CoA dehydrogenase [Cupriavidus taiwanensis]|nr:putative Acyl-CoA dehydrogenase [Cupriavidus taiwanensis]
MSDNMIEETVRRLLANEVSRELLTAVEAGAFAGALWQTIAESGMTKILCREAHGGIEASWSEALPLFYQVGYTQAPVPLAQAVVGQYLASRCGLDLAADSVFALAAGTQTRSLVLSSHDAGKPATLSGTMTAVKWARHARWLVVEAAGCLALVDAEGPGVRIEPKADAASLPADTVVLDQAVVSHALAANIAGLSRPLEVCYAATTAAQLTGALDYALDLAVQYAKDRVQFGKPIGKNQAIQQQLAVLAGEVACSYAAATTALRDLPAIHQHSAPQAEFSAAVAKVTASDAVRTGASIAHQVHGAIGFTYEYPLNFATRRLWAWRAEAGTSTEWAERLGQAFIQAGSDQFWANLTARTLPSVDGAAGRAVGHAESMQAERNATHA